MEGREGASEEKENRGRRKEGSISELHVNEVHHTKL